MKRGKNKSMEQHLVNHFSEKKNVIKVMSQQLKRELKKEVKIK